VVPVSTEKRDEQRSGLEERVHVDLPRIRPEDMVTTQEVVPARDPEAGRNTDMEFLTRNAGW
jgi:hypothetical protein